MEGLEERRDRREGRRELYQQVEQNTHRLQRYEQEQVNARRREDVAINGKKNPECVYLLILAIAICHVRQNRQVLRKKKRGE